MKLVFTLLLAISPLARGLDYEGNCKLRNNNYHG